MIFNVNPTYSWVQVPAPPFTILKKMKNKLKVILDDIKPKNMNQLNEKFNDLKIKLENSAKKLKIKCQVFLGGSLAKTTMLANNEELDVFVRFDKSHKNEELSNLLQSLLDDNKFKYTKIHGSRDYFKILKKKLTIELIPIYFINNPKEAINITDISPLHVKWIKKNIKNYSDDIKLAKQFCKSLNIYGAESYINGFSGYVLEILVINYNGFENFVKNAANWKNKTIIDIEKYYKNEKSLLQEINKSKTHSPLILIDPVQKERNASAAVNLESYNKLIFYCNRFLDNPSNDYFKIKKINEDEIQKQAKELDFSLYKISIIAKNENKDIVGTKIRKTKEFLERQLSLKGFTIARIYFNLENIWILYSPKELPKYVLRKGPQVQSDKRHINNFIEKHKEVFIKDNYLYAFVLNKDRKIKDCIKTALKNYELKNIEIKY